MDNVTALIMGALQGRELTEEEAARIIIAVCSRIRKPKPKRGGFDIYRDYDAEPLSRSNA